MRLATRVAATKAPRNTESSRSHEGGRGQEVVGIAAAAATVLLTLSLLSYGPNGGENWIGPVGHGLANLLTMTFGLAAWVVPFEIGAFTVRIFSRRENPLGAANLAAMVVIRRVAPSQTAQQTLAAAAEAQGPRQHLRLVAMAARASRC